MAWLFVQSVIDACGCTQCHQAACSRPCLYFQQECCILLRVPRNGVGFLVPPKRRAFCSQLVTNPPGCSLAGLRSSEMPQTSPLSQLIGGVVNADRLCCCAAPVHTPSSSRRALSRDCIVCASDSLLLQAIGVNTTKSPIRDELWHIKKAMSV